MRSCQKRKTGDTFLHIKRILMAFVEFKTCDYIGYWITVKTCKHPSNSSQIVPSSARQRVFSSPSDKQDTRGIKGIYMDILYYTILHYINTITLYELSPGHQVSSSNCVHLQFLFIFKFTCCKILIYSQLQNPSNSSQIVPSSARRCVFSSPSDKQVTRGIKGIYYITLYYTILTY